MSLEQWWRDMDEELEEFSLDFELNEQPKTVESFTGLCIYEHVFWFPFQREFDKTTFSKFKNKFRGFLQSKEFENIEILADFSYCDLNYNQFKLLLSIIKRFEHRFIDVDFSNNPIFINERVEISSVFSMLDDFEMPPTIYLEETMFAKFIMVYFSTITTPGCLILYKSAGSDIWRKRKQLISQRIYFCTALEHEFSDFCKDIRQVNEFGEVYEFKVTQIISAYQGWKSGNFESTLELSRLYSYVGWEKEADKKIWLYYSPAKALKILENFLKNLKIDSNSKDILIEIIRQVQKIKVSGFLQ
jgi:hypothetical protein